MYAAKKATAKPMKNGVFTSAKNHCENMTSCKEWKLAALDELSHLLTPEEWEIFHSNVENARNRKTRDAAIADGYKPYGVCKP